MQQAIVLRRVLVEIMGNTGIVAVRESLQKRMQVKVSKTNREKWRRRPQCPLMELSLIRTQRSGWKWRGKGRPIDKALEEERESEGGCARLNVRI
mmetsp:Transcript_20076/g.47804  ORF Transcript_20076/g.47804 Transcript_20076/m.47804 type:complete len:95 (+) Transcript_20076:79-363(+)